MRHLFSWLALGLFSSTFLVFGYVPRLTAEESVPATIKNSPASHKQRKVVQAANTQKGEKLEDFCIDTRGRILALLGPADQHEPGFMGAIAEAVSEAFNGSGKTGRKSPPKFENAVHVYDADGALLEKWPVGFAGQAINTAPDGTILIGGDGHLARFDASGKKLHEAASPQMTYINQNPEDMRERAKEQLESDRTTFAEQVKMFEDQLKEIKAAKEKEKKEGKESKAVKPAEEGADAAINEEQFAQIIQSYKTHLKVLEKQTVEETLQQVLGRAKRTHSIAASDTEVFVTCPALAGYGYGVWRTDAQFGQAKEIIKSLSGCCGQMDVQCCNGELYVCENSRHRVIRYNREGKEVGQFGKRDRDGEGENFGGCCNPMNLCFNKDGNLYVSESNGVVKHFTPQGKYLGIVGIADVQPGCKNSCVGVTADDSRLFYIDIYKSQIVVLARNAAGGTQ